MFKDNNLDAMIKLATESTKNITDQVKIYGTIMDNVIKGVVDEKDKKEIEKVKAITTSAINLAKLGKLDEANEMLKNFSNGYKNN